MLRRNPDTTFEEDPVRARRIRNPSSGTAQRSGTPVRESLRAALPLTQDDAHLRRAYRTHARPRLAELLGSIGLDVVYRRGQGDTLWFVEEGREVAVLDLLSGYGAGLLGHNHPELVAIAQECLRSGMVTHAQASCRGWSALLCETLARSLERAAGQDYVVHLLNTGTEAAEGAVRHAESSRREGLTRALARIESASRELTEELATLPAMQVAVLCEAARAADPRVADAADLVEILRRWSDLNCAAAAATPVFVALERAYHGSGTAAGKLSWGKRYRAGLSLTGIDARFVASDAPQALEVLLRETAISLWGPVRNRSGAWSVAAHSEPRVAALFIEAVQGEGGIRPVAAEHLRAFALACRKGGVTLVADEIQTGLGRTGRFLACEQAGLRPDIVLLSKVLGGGLAKIAALAIARRRYVHDFALQHASTFAEDDFSSRIALGVIELLERDREALMQRSRRLGERFLTGLRRLQQRWPQVLADVRGRGLMLGIEFADQRGNPSPMIRALDSAEALGGIAAGWLLAEERVRLAPALRNPRTLRIQPPATIRAAGIRRALTALDRLCGLIACGDVLRLTAFLHGEDPGVAAPPAETAGGVFRVPPPDFARGTAYAVAHAQTATRNPRVAFLGHFIDAGSVRGVEPRLEALSDQGISHMLRRMEAWSDHFPFRRFATRSRTGQEVEALIVAWAILPGRWMAARRDPSLYARLVADIRDAFGEVIEEGCRWVGFGGFTSILTDACKDVRNSGIRVTSGNSLTVGMAARGLERAAVESGIALREETVAIVGATGNIGRMHAHLAAPSAGRLLLLGRPGSEARLREVRGEIRERYPMLAEVELTTDLARLRECRGIVTASNSPQPIVGAQHIADGPVAFLDVSVPQDAFPDLAAARPELCYIRGGVVRLPDGEAVSRLQLPGWHLPDGHGYACLCETLLLGLEDLDSDYSCGPLEPDRVRRILALADRHGFELGAYKTLPTV
jgi:acetylornithine/succinyldiaminopimelate/putrescine aminotransferase/predicted amino acid dehydrogenase